MIPKGAIAGMLLATGCGMLMCGCLAAAPIAPVASAAGFGYSAWVGSRLRFVEDAGFDVVSLSTERAMVGLGLDARLTTEIRTKGLPRTRVYEIRSERGDLAVVRLRRLTPMMTDITIDVGILGNRPAGELMADHIRWYTDGDTIRASRRAAIVDFSSGADQPVSQGAQAPETDPGPDFGQGLF